MDLKEELIYLFHRARLPISNDVSVNQRCEECVELALKNISSDCISNNLCKQKGMRVCLYDLLFESNERDVFDSDDVREKVKAMADFIEQYPFRKLEEDPLGSMIEFKAKLNDLFGLELTQ